MKAINKTLTEGARPHGESPFMFIASNCALLVLALFAFGFIFENFVIPSPSMASTLLVGDHVLVDRLSVAPPSAWAKLVTYREERRGDNGVFYKHTEEPGGDHLILVKQVIGVAGDHIHLRNGFVYLNGTTQ